MAQKSTPESTVKAFYTWYIAYPSSDWPLDDKKINEYVEPLAATQIRGLYQCGSEDCYYGHDYFTKTQDWDKDDWLKHMTISKPLFSGNKAIVTIQLGSRYALQEGARNHLIVILKKVGEKWMITDVAGANDRQQQK
ncbi:MAG: YbjP/YqhG family protein [Burkholderiaceae bacterium]|nr:YbjP/YqhG family protein [Burkholderiaceae bacterium]